jgi:hypothetical protein
MSILTSLHTRTSLLISGSTVLQMTRLLLGLTARQCRRPNSICDNTQKIHICICWTSQPEYECRRPELLKMPCHVDRPYFQPLDRRPRAPGTCGHNGDITRMSPSAVTPEKRHYLATRRHTGCQQSKYYDIFRTGLVRTRESHHEIRLSIVAAYQADELLGLAS